MSYTISESLQADRLALMQESVRKKLGAEMLTSEEQDLLLQSITGSGNLNLGLVPDRRITRLRRFHPAIHCSHITFIR